MEWNAMNGIAVELELELELELALRNSHDFVPTLGK